MLVGICTTEVLIPGSDSLKDKRRVIKSFKDRVRGHFNVSVAEVEHQDNHTRAVMGLSMVSNEIPLIQNTLDQIIRLLESYPEVELIYRQVQIIKPEEAPWLNQPKTVD